ncbi:hypothetical protein [Kitasatospora sp. CB01950]|uniref:hypothetical protein n=1 Tax=Kitasatospora sp. CB01950 TaxID=1703930 RepID=UPI001F51A062|nr:hypothetical protein [Kitasatospora sp. CB01950]
MDGITAGFPPEMFLHFVFRLPEGGARVWDAWTAGGDELGDVVDGQALAAGLDAADTFHLTARHVSDHYRGRIHIQAHPLRPIRADVLAGLRAPVNERAALLRMVALAGSTGTALPRWMGVGPRLRSR